MWLWFCLKAWKTGQRSSQRQRKKVGWGRGEQGTGSSLRGNKIAPPLPAYINQSSPTKRFVFLVQHLQGAAHNCTDDCPLYSSLLSVSLSPSSLLSLTSHPPRSVGYMPTINMWHMSLTSQEDPSPQGLGSSVNLFSSPTLPALFHALRLNIELLG